MGLNFYRRREILTKKTFKELLKIWWSIPYGLDFIPYNINKGKTFGALNKYV
jgi:hypothetical protein